MSGNGLRRIVLEDLTESEELFLSFQETNHPGQGRTLQGMEEQHCMEESIGADPNVEKHPQQDEGQGQGQVGTHEEYEDELADVLEISEEALGRSYNMPDVDEDELEAELDALGDEIALSDEIVLGDDTSYLDEAVHAPNAPNAPEGIRNTVEIPMEEQDEPQHEEQDKVDQDEQEELDLTEGFNLQQFQRADGGMIVLPSEQSAQTQEGTEEQHYVEEIIGADPKAEEHHGHHAGEDQGHDGMGTHKIRIDADGNPQIGTSDEQMHDLITLHAVGVDSQGNLISGHAEEAEGGSMEEHVEIAMDHTGMEDMMEEDNVVEVVISAGNHEEDNFLSEDNMAVNNKRPQEFLNVQEAIFNPETETLQPITSVQTPVTTSTISKPHAQQQVKNLICQPSSDGSQGQQLISDASSQQGLVQGGTLSLDGATGKNIILQSSPAKAKPVSSRSPAKILPPPVPVGDQQQGSGVQKLLFKQGNILTPVSLAGGNQGETRVIQIPGSSGNQFLCVRVISNKTPIAPSNKIPIAPAFLKPKPVAPKPAPGQTIFTLPAGTTAQDLDNCRNSQGTGNHFLFPNNNIVNNVASHHQSPQLRQSDSMGSSSGGGSVLTDCNSIHGGLSQSAQGQLDSFRSILEPIGMRPKKPCNCTKTQCLKLYCDCFVNGEFCQGCNCTNCYNNLNHEEDRQKALKLVLERNPGAFRPKIGKSSMTGEAHERRHNKGCKCKKSGCVKNYCECYEAKIFCSRICKCTGCKNCIENIPSGLPNGVGVELHFVGSGTADRQTVKDLAKAAEVRVQQQNQVKNKLRAQIKEISPQNNLGIMVPPLVFRDPHGSISHEVITSMVELLLAKAEAGEKQKLSDGEIERLILDEFSECLASVMDLGSTIDCATVDGVST